MNFNNSSTDNWSLDAAYDRICALKIEIFPGNECACHVENFRAAISPLKYNPEKALSARIHEIRTWRITLQLQWSVLCDIIFEDAAKLENGWNKENKREL